MTQNYRKALVTGAASGIGAATARWLDANGVNALVLVDRDPVLLEGPDFKARTECHLGDVSDPHFWNSLAPSLEGLNLAVASAGVASGGAIKDMAFDDWRRVLSVNLDGAFLTLQAAMRAMANGGSIVLLSSATALKPVAGAGAYGASKAALAHLAKTAALEGAPLGIRINALAPGGVDTPIWDKEPAFRAMVAEQGREAAISAMASATPNRRFATPEEIAETIGFLLSDSAANITGTLLPSDGGYSA